MPLLKKLLLLGIHLNVLPWIFSNGNNQFTTGNEYDNREQDALRSLCSIVRASVGCYILLVPQWASNRL